VVAQADSTMCAHYRGPVQPPPPIRLALICLRARTSVKGRRARSPPGPAKSPRAKRRDWASAGEHAPSPFAHHYSGGSSKIGEKAFAAARASSLPPIALQRRALVLLASMSANSRSSSARGSGAPRVRDHQHRHWRRLGAFSGAVTAGTLRVWNMAVENLVALIAAPCEGLQRVSSEGGKSSRPLGTRGFGGTHCDEPEPDPRRS